MSVQVPAGALSPMGRDHMNDDAVRPSHDSQNGLLRHVSRPTENRGASATPDPYGIRMEYERGPEELPPPRHPSRQGQLKRWEPAPSHHGWDEQDDRRPYARPSYDYGAQERGVPVPNDYYEDPRYSHAYRRPVPSQAAQNRGPPQPPRRPHRKPHFEESSGSESDDSSVTPRKRRKSRRGREATPEEMMRLPFTMWMNSSFKNHFVAAVGEFVGTTMFLMFAFAGTQVANANTSTTTNTTTNASTGFDPTVLMYIALCFGFSLMVNVWIFFRISGGLFNPAVTLAMVMVDSINYVRGFLLLGAQILGSIFASLVVSKLFPTEFNVRTTLSSETSLVRGVFIEALLTAELVFAIFMLAKEKHKATFMAPIGIGLALFVAELVGVYYTGGSLNPARSFGPCVVSGEFDKEHWIYWVGPAAGAVIAVVFYKMIKILEYEVANPGQDETSEHAAASAAATAAEKQKEEV